MLSQVGDVSKVQKYAMGAYFGSVLTGVRRSPKISTAWVQGGQSCSERRFESYCRSSDFEVHERSQRTQCAGYALLRSLQWELDFWYGLASCSTVLGACSHLPDGHVVRALERGVR